MTRFPKARLGRLWIRFSQSSRFLPVVGAVFLALCVLTTLYINIELIHSGQRVQAAHDDHHRHLLQAFSNRHEQQLTRISSQLELLANASGSLSGASLRAAMTRSRELLAPLGVTHVGRLDDRATPALILEVGSGEVPPCATVQATVDLNRWCTADSSRRTPEHYVVIGPPTARANGIQYYARLQVEPYVAGMIPPNVTHSVKLVTPSGRLYALTTFTPSDPDSMAQDSATPAVHLRDTCPAAHDLWLGHEPAADPRSLLVPDHGRGLGMLFLPFESSPKDGYTPALLLTFPTGGTQSYSIINFIRINAILLVFYGILLLIGLTFASYQQRLSHKLKQVVGEQDQIISGIISNVVDGIIVFDDEDTIQMWNRGSQLIFGYSADEMLGNGPERLIPPDFDAAEEQAYMAKVVSEKGFLKNHVTQRVRADGKRITVDISRTPYYNENGVYQGYTTVVKDVTEKLDLDRKMYSTEKLASIGLLASGVAHEINNPLSIILGFVDLMKERFEPDSQEFKDLALIESNALQAKEIVDDLLGFSRAEQVADVQVNVKDSLEKFVEFLGKTRLVKQVQIEVSAPETIPNAHGDPRELQQVLLNLVNNAVAAIDHRDGHICINASHPKPDRVLITVADNGHGIPVEVRPKIFDPFFTTKDFGEGTGLGLSLCYGLVKKWGGDIDFESSTREEAPNLPSGTTFTISIPVYEDSFNPEASG